MSTPADESGEGCNEQQETSIRRYYVQTYEATITETGQQTGQGFQLYLKNPEVNWTTSDLPLIDETIHGPIVTPHRTGI